MSIWSRIKTIVKSIVHWWLDRISDPVKIIRAKIKEKEVEVIKFRKELAIISAKISIMKSKKTFALQKLNDLTNHARQAIKQNDEESAREHARQISMIKRYLPSLNKSISLTEKIIKSLEKELFALETQLEGLRIKKAEVETTAALKGVSYTAAKNAYETDYDIEELDEFILGGLSEAECYSEFLKDNNEKFSLEVAMEVESIREGMIENANK